MGLESRNLVKVIGSRARFLSCAQSRLSIFLPHQQRSFSSTVDIREKLFYRPRETTAHNGGGIGPALGSTRRLFHCTPRVQEEPELTELKVGHFFTASIMFPKMLANSSRGRRTLKVGALRAVYAEHQLSGNYKRLKRRPCLLYAKDHYTLTVLVCTSRPPAQLAHRFAPFNYAPRLTGQPPAFLHSAENPDSAGGGYIFFTHALVARLVRGKGPVGSYRQPGGIYINRCDVNTGDTWVPSRNYRLSVQQLAYIEELHRKFWGGVRYDEHGMEITAGEVGSTEKMEGKISIRRVIDGSPIDESPGASFLPKITARRERDIMLKSAVSDQEYWRRRRWRMWRMARALRNKRRMRRRKAMKMKSITRRVQSRAPRAVERASIRMDSKVAIARETGQSKKSKRLARKRQKMKKAAATVMDISIAREPTNSMKKELAERAAKNKKTEPTMKSVPNKLVKVKTKNTERTVCEPTTLAGGKPVEVETKGKSKRARRRRRSLHEPQTGGPITEAAETREPPSPPSSQPPSTPSMKGKLVKRVGTKSIEAKRNSPPNPQIKGKVKNTNYDPAGKIRESTSNAAETDPEGWGGGVHSYRSSYKLQSETRVTDITIPPKLAHLTKVFSVRKINGLPTQVRAHLIEGRGTDSSPAQEPVRLTEGPSSRRTDASLAQEPVNLKERPLVKKIDNPPAQELVHFKPLVRWLNISSAHEPVQLKKRPLTRRTESSPAQKPTPLTKTTLVRRTNSNPAYELMRMDLIKKAYSELAQEPTYLTEGMLVRRTGSELVQKPAGSTETKIMRVFGSSSKTPLARRSSIGWTKDRVEMAVSDVPDGLKTKSGTWREVGKLARPSSKVESTRESPS